MEKKSFKFIVAFQENVNNYIHLIIYLDNGWQVALSDLRKFAKVEVFNARNAGEKKNLKTLVPTL